MLLLLLMAGFVGALRGGRLVSHQFQPTLLLAGQNGRDVRPS